MEFIQLGFVVQPELYPATEGQVISPAATSTLEEYTLWKMYWVILITLLLCCCLVLSVNSLKSVHILISLF